MKTGKYSYNAQQRSIIRPIKKVQKPADGFAQNYDCAMIDCNKEKIIASQASMTAETQLEARLIFCRACNQVYAQYGKVKMVNITWICPENSEEEKIAKMTEYLAILCKEKNIMLGAVNASVSSFVSRNQLVVNAIGYISFEELSNNPEDISGYTLCMAGHAGMAGVGLLASELNEELKKQYTQGFISQAQTFLEELDMSAIMEALKDSKSRIYPIQEGGILNALWNFADGADVGLDVDMRKLPIRQESVEISEFYGLNPYQLMADGSCLIASRQPEYICAKLERAGVMCRIIGQITNEKARVIRRDEEVRYLDKPAQEELEKVRKIL